MFEAGDAVHLAVEHGCVDRLEDECGVLRELKQEVGELGVVGEVPPHVVNDVGRRCDVHVDFYSVPPGLANGLERAVKDDHPEGTRYVLVGRKRRHRVVAEKHGWEYVDFEEVARSRGWSLG
ncbi:MAG: hypothetical protein ACLFMT_06695 [Halobacteriales archaeon]